MKIKSNKLILVLTLSLFVLLVFGVSVSAKTIYVSEGANGNGTAGNPYGSIQKAADIAQPGDVIMINPGVYYEHVVMRNTGTKEQPIIFRASEYGKNKVIITGADKDIRTKAKKWECVDVENNIYSVDLSWCPMRVLYDGVNILRYKYYDELTTCRIQTGDKSQSTYGDGFYYDTEKQKLFVRIRTDGRYGSKNINEHLICVSPRAYSTVTHDDKTYTAGNVAAIGDDSYNFAIINDDPAYVALYGITMETPGFTGVFIRSSHVTVSNCWFVGCANGVAGGAYGDDDVYSSDNVTVEYCEWSQFPLAEEMYEMMKDGRITGLDYTWQAKNTGFSVNCYEVGSFVGRAGDYWTIRNNHISNALDGLSFFAWTKYNTKISGRGFGVSAEYVEIYENKFEKLLDNAIEFETRLKNAEFHHNDISECLEAFSIQPLNGPDYPTNIKIHHNKLWESQEFVDMYLKKVKFRTGIFKFCINQITNYEFPWSVKDSFKTSPSRPARTLSYSDQGIDIYNNTLYAPGQVLTNLAGRIGGDRGEKSNLRMFNNIICCAITSSADGVAKNGQFFDGDDGDLLSEHQGYEFGRNIYIPSNKTQKLNDDCVSMKDSWAVYSFTEAGVPNMESGDISLEKNSLPCSNGRKIVGEDVLDTQDIGAVKAGESWKINYSPYPYGDIDCDGKVTEMDLILISKAIHNPDGVSISRYDLSFDGVINQTDMNLAFTEYAKNTN